MSMTPEIGRFDGYGPDAPLPLHGASGPTDFTGLLSRFADGTMDALSEAMSSVNHCAHPIRLIGSSTTIDTATGEVLDTFRSTDAPLGMLYRACGNRRAHVCPSCSRTYARDTFELIRAGVAGGKTVPTGVAENPLLFATFTAPSFGAVHTISGASGLCRPRRREDRTRCPHGRPTWCTDRHDNNDETLGAPLCSDCYDLHSSVIWQWWAPELWRRTTIALRRQLAVALEVPESRLGDVASVQFAKVAEYQRRGLVHFHALIRLDGPNRDGIGAPAPANLTAADLRRLVTDAARSVRFTVPGVDADDPDRTLGWGSQVDVRVVNAGRRTDDPAGPLAPEQVAGYLAKYATKDASGIHGQGQQTPHLMRMRAACHDLHERAFDAHGEESPYLLLSRWSHMLGFRGHFSSKSRRYSVTLGALRRARTRWQRLAADSRRTGQPIDTTDLERQLLADDESTTLVVGSWVFAGTGWRDEAEQALALAAAGRAREYAQWRADKSHNGIHR